MHNFMNLSKLNSIICTTYKIKLVYESRIIISAAFVDFKHILNY